MLNTPDRVNSLQQVAERCGFSLITLKRLLAAGEGPKTTQLSTRRLGIRESHLLEWLDSNVRNGDQAKAKQQNHAQADEAAA